MTTWSPKKYNAGEVPNKKAGGIILVVGHPGVGKSQFCIDTADVAMPLFYLNFDRDASHLLKGYKGTEGYYYEEFTALHKTQAEDCLKRVEGMKNAGMSVGHGVFVIDNAAALWDIVKLAKLPDLDKNLPKEFAPANQWLRDLMLGLERSGLWVILTAPPKEIWSGAKTSTGLYQAEGWKHVDFHIMAELWLYTTKPLGPEAQPAGSGTVAGEVELPAKPLILEFKGQISEAKKRMSMVGMILKNPRLANFLKIVKEVE